jgi:hypothetical protein
MSHGRPLAVAALVCIASLTTFSLAGRDKPATTAAAVPLAQPKAELALVQATGPASRMDVTSAAPGLMPDRSHMPPRRVPIELAGSY